MDKEGKISLAEGTMHRQRVISRGASGLERLEGSDFRVIVSSVIKDDR